MKRLIITLEVVVHADPSGYEPHDVEVEVERFVTENYLHGSYAEIKESNLTTMEM
jgi:hypothetical protein